MTEALFSQFWIQRLGWTLLHFLWQGTAIAMAYALLRGMLRNSLGSEGRYLLACVALAAMAMAPAITFVLLPREADSAFAMSWSISVSAWQRVLPGFVAVWMAGVLAFSIRLYGGWRFTARLRSTSHPAPSEWQRTLERIGARVGNSRRVCLLVSSLVDVPTVIGWLRPVILVPVSALTGLPPEHVAALLAHEIAHVRRHDYLASVLQSVAEAVLFYHPAVWWVSRQIRAEREMCCDDLAVAASGDVLTYARALEQLESIQPQRLKPALAANGGSLVNRIRRLVDPAQPATDNLPGAGAASAMTLLWLAGVGVATVHAAQTSMPTPPVVRLSEISRTASPSPFAPLAGSAPAPANRVAQNVKQTLLFDPFLTAQSIQPQVSSIWKDWLDSDAAEIITAEERTAFVQLNTDEEREQFVEQFWLVRDPTPATFLNEFKEEHYRRIAYVNQHFGWGQPGMKTDRGRTYIRYGPPDEIESHPAGTQQPFAIEDWRYRFIEGLGNNTVLEFADTAGTGEFRLGPGQRDVLSSNNLNGMTAQQEQDRALAEFNRSIESAEFFLQQLRRVYADTYPVIQTTMKQLELLKSKRDALQARAGAAALASATQRAAATEANVRFQDLEWQASTQTNVNVLPMKARWDYLRGPGSTVLVNLTVQFENRDLQFQQKNGVMTATVNLFGRITSLTRRPISTFEPTLAASFPVGSPTDRTQQEYQQSVPLLPGRYYLNLVAKDIMSGKVNVYEVELDVPEFFEGKLTASSLILADTIEKLPVRQLGGSMFAIGDSKVRPRVGGTFSSSEKMGVYLQIYNLTPDATTQKPFGSVEYEVDLAQSGAKIVDVFQDLETIEYASASQVTIQKLLPLTTYAPGNYTIKVTVTDRNGNQTVQRQENFIVSAQ